MAAKQTEKNTPLQIVLGSLLCIGLIPSIFPASHAWLSWGGNYAVHSMFAYLGLGLFFLVIRQPRLMFTSFLCCAVLCLFLKNASSNDIIYPTATAGSSVSIAQVTISASNDAPEMALQQLLESDADILSIHELTPDWGDLLEETLAERYPFGSAVYRPEDFLGIAVYSKYPIHQLDTFYYNDIPNIGFTINGHAPNEQVHFVSSYIYPNIATATEQVVGHFDAIGAYVEKKNGPVITFGDYNQVQWSSLIQNFRQETNLNDSRRFPFFEYPSDHIFYSNHFKCTDFHTISSPATKHFGIIGHFQLNEHNQYAQKAARKF